MVPDNIPEILALPPNRSTSILFLTCSQQPLPFISKRPPMRHNRLYSFYIIEMPAPLCEDHISWTLWSPICSSNKIVRKSNLEVVPRFDFSEVVLREAKAESGNVRFEVCSLAAADDRESVGCCAKGDY